MTKRRPTSNPKTTRCAGCGRPEGDVELTELSRDIWACDGCVIRAARAIDAGRAAVDAPMKRPTGVELRQAALTLRAVLNAFDAGDDTRADRVVRRHLEGAVTATELASGKRSGPVRP